MAHSHDRNLVQSLGIETDHKSPDHDLAVLYLQANAQALARKVLPLPGKTSSFVPVESEHLQRILTPHELCAACKIRTQGEWMNNGTHQKIMCSKVATDIRVNDTELEYQVTKGEGKFQTLIGFLDVVIYAQFTGILAYDAAEYVFERRCMSGPDNPHFRADPKRWKDQPHSGVLTVRYDGKQHADQGMERRNIAVEVKTRPVSLGDALRQISLYREYHRANVWVFATTVPLDASYRNALEHENIRTLLISEEYKNVKQIRAEMETL